ncbi:37S ribosomal protein S22 [Boothiomyces macroporosus]|uniref:37S ribosomal protein S22 n=1 Tax=Boothiomyces macroporosus TaxID=261099 RepID=A0AAD5UJ47_9FUNG|nr:37S ribosomal protein S22 [Boothiomyces macroporosus]
MSKAKRKLLKEICSNRLGIISIHPELDNQINLLLKETNFKYIKECADRISNALASTGSSMVKAKVALKAQELNRKIITTPHVLSYDKYESIAYTASRMVPSYAAIFNVLTQLRKRYPEFNPKSMIDFGVGTGSGVFAANLVWKDIQRTLGIDLSEHMLKVVERFSNADPALAIRNLKLQRYLAIIDKPNSDAKADLVLSAFTLSELPNDNNRKLTVKALWRQTNDILILIDRGNPSGFNAISAARTQLINLCKEENTEFHIIAPCQHEKPCPMLGNRYGHWCHTSQRYTLNESMVIFALIQRRLLDKAPRENQKDIKYSYLVISKRPRPTAHIDVNQIVLQDLENGDSVQVGKTESSSNSSALKVLEDGKELAQPSYRWDRIVMPLIKGKKHIIADLCTTDGDILRSTVSKSNSPEDSYSLLRKLDWGDLWPFKSQNGSAPAWNTPKEDLQKHQSEKEKAKKQKLNKL